jgi:lipopolysaccharide/colanic/teichoic acid biosynthesis glycosyltransferase
MYGAVKRILDLIVAAGGLLLLSPLLALLALAIAVSMGTPVLFRQVRPGYQGQPFILLKFRTMNDGRDPSGNFFPDACRLTPLGRWLRRLSLDELPELWNVLRGEMSLVGPRPLLVRYLERYSPQQMRRHEVKPGITGWAQINGRNNLPWEQKFQLDCWYVDHRGICVDTRILIRTVIGLCRPRGISQEGYSTMPEYMGTESANVEKRGEI